MACPVSASPSSGYAPACSASNEPVYVSSGRRHTTTDPVTLPEDYPEVIASYALETLETRLATLESGGSSSVPASTRELLCGFLCALDRGDARAAVSGDDGWRSNRWVKRGILAIFGHADITDYEYGPTYHRV